MNRFVNSITDIFFINLYFGSWTFVLQDVELVRRSSVCRICVKCVRGAYSFKTSYLTTADEETKNENDIALKKEIESEELIKCQICKNFEHYCVPLSQIMEEDKMSQIIQSLSLEVG